LITPQHPAIVAKPCTARIPLQYGNTGWDIGITMPRITSKGQVTIPKRIRDHLGLKPGSEVEFQYDGDGRIVLKADQSVDTKTRADRERKRMEKALAELRGTLDLGMTTDEFMRFVRGDPDE
jgi:AbrB family looped-hinge helix DNA binding protein